MSPVAHAVELVAPQADAGLVPRQADAGLVALVVDDNQLNSSLAGHMLKRLGWRHVAVSSGEAALERIAEAHFDLVLLDLRMPRMSGEEVCRRIRHQLGNGTLPVVAYTAHGMPEEKARMLQAGFSGMLIKPITFEDVRRLCEELAAPGAMQPTEGTA